MLSLLLLAEFRSADGLPSLSNRIAFHLIEILHIYTCMYSVYKVSSHETKLHHRVFFWGLRPQFDCTMKSCSLNALTAEVLHDTRRFSEQAPILTEVLSTRHFLSSIARIFHQFPIMEAENKDNMKSKSSRIIEKKGSSKEKSHIDCLQTKIITFSLMPKWKKWNLLFLFSMSYFYFWITYNS